MELLLKVEGAEWGYDEDRGVHPWRPVEDADGDGKFEVSMGDPADHDHDR
jgi:hypothetical protein